MDISGLMNRQPFTIGPDDPLSEVLRITLEKRVRSLAAVDHGGRYLGMVSLHQLLGLLLPRSARVDHGLADLAFVTDSLDDLRHVLRQFAGDRVADHLDPEVPVVHPDTTLVEAVLIMYRSGENLPVVDRGTGKLVGLISPWEVLPRLA